MASLFPPYLNKGSKDLKEHGPVHLLQSHLSEYWPGLAKYIGFVADGDYGEKTAVLVAACQDQINGLTRFNGWNDPEIEVDGNFGPDTRQALEESLRGWNLYCGATEAGPDNECMYVGPDSPEPQLWDPLAETLPPQSLMN